MSVEERKEEISIEMDRFIREKNNEYHLTISLVLAKNNLIERLAIAEEKNRQLSELIKQK